jgi:hypothetical protein
LNKSSCQRTYIESEAVRVHFDWLRVLVVQGRVLDNVRAEPDIDALNAEG